MEFYLTPVFIFIGSYKKNIAYFLHASSSKGKKKRERESKMGMRFYSLTHSKHVQTASLHELAAQSEKKQEKMWGAPSPVGKRPCYFTLMEVQHRKENQGSGPVQVHFSFRETIEGIRDKETREEEKPKTQERVPLSLVNTIHWTKSCIRL